MFEGQGHLRREGVRKEGEVPLVYTEEHHIQLTACKTGEKFNDGLSWERARSWSISSSTVFLLWIHVDDHTSRHCCGL